jgi:predicted PurR-regulated permease PerM
VLALLVGTGLAGVLGALLALPVAGALQVILGEVLEHRRSRMEARANAPRPAADPG